MNIDVADDGSSTNDRAKAQAKSKLAHIPSDNTSELDDLLEDYEVVETTHLYEHGDDKDKLKAKLQAYISKRVEEAQHLHSYNEPDYKCVFCGLTTRELDSQTRKSAQLTEGKDG